jgi:hypothetical protein
MQITQTTVRTLLAATATAALLLGAATTSLAQSANDPTGEAPIGIEEKSDAKGPSLTGVLVVEFANSDGVSADGARITVRLRRGSMVATFFGILAGPLDFETEEQRAMLQDAILNQPDLREGVLGTFFPGDCGSLGDQCPTVALLLKKADEFGLTDDGVSNQIVILDVTVATSVPL